MLSVWGWAASAWHLAQWLRRYFRSARLTSDQVPGQDHPSVRDEPGPSTVTVSTSGRLGSEATETSSLDSAGDAPTPSPCSVESDSWDDSTALSWDMEAEEDEALDPARFGASPSADLLQGHLDFGCWDGAMDTPAAVFVAGQESAVVPFRNASGEPLSLAVDSKGLWVHTAHPPEIRLEPASGQLGPGEEGRLTLRLNDYAGVLHSGCFVHVELRSRAGEEERIVEIPLVRASHIFPIVRMPIEQFMLPHSQRPHIAFTVQGQGQALWVRFGRCAEAEVLGAGAWVLVNQAALRASLRLLSPGGGGAVHARLGEAVAASPGDVEELAGLQGEELTSRTQVLANLAFHSRSLEAPSVSLKATLRLSRVEALATEPDTEVVLPRAPLTSAVRLRNRSDLYSLVWAAEAPRGLLCEPPAGVLGPGAEAELQLSAGAQRGLSGKEEEEGSGGRLLIRSGYVPPEEREAVAAAPGDFVRQEHRLFPHSLHTTSLALVRNDHCSIS